MNVRKMAGMAFAVMLLAMAGSARAAITIDTVPVGNPGNAADTAAHSGNSAGQGSVGYTYNIGTYEVTAGQYTEFLTAVAKTDTYGLYSTSMDTAVSVYGCNIKRTGSSGSYAYSVTSDWANRPVNNVSWGDSARFANWLHNGQPTGTQNLITTEHGAYSLNGATSDAALLAVNRETDWKWAITSEDEWYKAAYYNPATGTYFDYPTSSNTAPGRDMADASGNNANYYTGSGACPIDSDKYTTVVGEFQNSESPYGTFDQGGNVWEWNEATLSGSSRGLRGGSFIDGAGDLLASSRTYGNPSGEDNSVGFRVSAVPEPATMAVLTLGGIGLLRRRRALGR